MGFNDKEKIEMFYRIVGKITLLTAPTYTKDFTEGYEDCLNDMKKIIKEEMNGYTEA
jgi:hypothetical protein